MAELDALISNLCTCNLRKSYHVLISFGQFLFLYFTTLHNCDWLWENLPVMHQDNYLRRKA